MRFIVSRSILLEIGLFHLLVLLEQNAVADFSGIYFFQIHEPDYLRYSYQVKLAKNFGSDFQQLFKNVRLTLADPVQACSELKNRVSNTVVLIERGECSFLTKAITAAAAGAYAVIVSDTKNPDDAVIEMMTDETGRNVDIPAVYLPGIDGQRLRSHLAYKSSPIVISIPLNLSLVPLDMVRKPPWDLW